MRSTCEIYRWDPYLLDRVELLCHLWDGVKTSTFEYSRWRPTSLCFTASLLAYRAWLVHVVNMILLTISRFESFPLFHSNASITNRMWIYRFSMIQKKYVFSAARVLSYLLMVTVDLANDAVSYFSQTMQLSQKHHHHVVLSSSSLWTWVVSVWKAGPAFVVLVAPSCRFREKNPSVFLHSNLHHISSLRRSALASQQTTLISLVHPTSFLDNDGKTTSSNFMLCIRREQLDRAFSPIDHLRDVLPSIWINYQG